MNLLAALRTAPPADWRGRFHRRCALAGWLLLAWGVLLAARLLTVMLFPRADLLARADVGSWRIGTVPALRGRLLSQAGVPLAWSVRRFELEYEVPAQPELVQTDQLALRTALSGGVPSLARLELAPGARLVLLANLSPTQLLPLSRVIAANPRFRVVSSFVRQRAYGGPEWSAALGDTRVCGQKEVGLSGWEREHDARLRGEDGKYRVMVDRDGRWVPGTWSEIRPPAPGQDVYLPVTVAAPATAAVGPASLR